MGRTVLHRRDGLGVVPNQVTLNRLCSYRHDGPTTPSPKHGPLCALGQHVPLAKGLGSAKHCCA
jgi:hypothetical protein